MSKDTERAAQYDGDTRESRAAFRNYDSVSEPVSKRTPWQIWRDACAWQFAALAQEAQAVPRERNRHYPPCECPHCKKFDKEARITKRQSELLRALSNCEELSFEERAATRAALIALGEKA